MKMTIEHIECASPAAALQVVKSLTKQGVFAYVLQGSTVSICR